jgi:hypothetical protein
MKNPTPYLPGFSHRLCGRRAGNDAARLSMRSDRLDGLAALVARFIPAQVFTPEEGRRERVFTPWVTFIAFFGQVLSLPAELAVRIVRFRVTVPGFRTDEVVLITTLLDTKAYPDEAIIALYRRRWAVELCFRDIKTTLGLDVLRCQSPELVEKEIWLQAIAYNLVRALMLEAAWTHAVALERLSFKGTVDTLRQWTPLFAPTMFAFKRAREELLRIIAADQVPYRPNRSEPRVRKRRPKPYQMLTRPRHLMTVSPSRAIK